MCRSGPVHVRIGVLVATLACRYYGSSQECTCIHVALYGCGLTLEFHTYRTSIVGAFSISLVSLEPKSRGMSYRGDDIPVPTYPYCCFAQAAACTDEA